MKRIGIILAAVAVFAGCGGNQYQNYSVKSAVPCPGQPPLQFGAADIRGTAGGGLVLANPGECILVQWKWLGPWPHWHGHTADVGVYRLIPTTSTTVGK